MGLFEKIFGKKPKPAQVQGGYKMLTGYDPVFTAWDGKLYENELIRAVVNSNATHISKLRVEFTGHGAAFLQKRLQQPNAFQTWSQFLYRLATIYYTDNTVFIVPVMDGVGRVVELYAVLPSRCRLVSVEDAPWLAFEFRDGHVMQQPVWKIGVMRRFQYRNDVFGESNDALNATMQMITVQNQGITEAVKSAATYRFMAQMGNLAFADDLKKEQNQFNDAAFAPGKGGLLLFPATYSNIQQVSSKPYVADADTLKIIRDNVFNYYGNNMDVLQGCAYGDKWTAFYETTVESFAIEFSEVFTRMMQMCGELSGNGLITATANRLAYMSNSEKLQVSAQLADRGILNRDEIREIWNLPPLPDGQGQDYIIRGEYHNAADKVGGDNDNKEDGQNE